MEKALICLIAFGVIFCIFWFITWPKRRYRAGYNHGAVIDRAVSRYPEFSNITASFGTLNDGGIMVMGEVSTADELTRLKRIVESTDPPTRVVYMVRIHKPPKSNSR